jgi:large subunit ribosomal protein L36
MAARHRSEAERSDKQRHEQEEETVMKVRNSLRSLKSKPGAQVVRRRGVTFVVNKKNPRFKARQG